MAGNDPPHTSPELNLKWKHKIIISIINYHSQVAFCYEECWTQLIERLKWMCICILDVIASHWPNWIIFLWKRLSIIRDIMMSVLCELIKRPDCLPYKVRMGKIDIEWIPQFEWIFFSINSTSSTDIKSYPLGLKKKQTKN